MVTGTGLVSVTMTSSARILLLAHQTDPQQGLELRERSRKVVGTANFYLSGPNVGLESLVYIFFNSPYGPAVGHPQL